MKNKKNKATKTNFAVNYAQTTHPYQKMMFL